VKVGVVGIYNIVRELNELKNVGDFQTQKPHPIEAINRLLIRCGVLVLGV
jgi:hypothetical protein